MAMKLTAIFDMADKVIIDEDPSIVGTVTAVLFRGSGLNVTYEVSYMHCGSSYSVWIESWRISPWDA